MPAKFISFLLGLCAVVSTAADVATFRIGTAECDITPTDPIRLSGYASRKSTFESVAGKLWLKAIALEQNGKERAIFLSVDNCGITEPIRDRLLKSLQGAGITSHNLVIFNSHTHSAPCLTGALGNLFGGPIPDDQQEAIAVYTAKLIEDMKKVCLQASGTLREARLFFGKSSAAFAKNRRTVGGPVDHDLPVLIAKDKWGKVISILANYACHCTTLGGENNKVHGDWAGFAQEFLHENHPDALAMIAIGCGADSNPDPRGQMEHALNYGKQIAAGVRSLLEKPLVQLTNSMTLQSKYIQLPFEPLPSRENWVKRAQESGIIGYHGKRNLERLDRGEKLPEQLGYLIQTWNFGPQLAMVFLPGEVVVDYSLRLKREFNAERLWVSGYANYVPCYIPSVRILNEGGYEAETSLWYYDQPAKLSLQTESLIIKAIHELMPKEFKTPAHP